MSAAAASLTIYMIGGTSEANEAAQRLLAAGYRVVTSVATEHGRSLAQGSETDVGRKDAVHMAARISEAGANMLLDCSHPYAVSASREARRAASLARVPYLRYCRPAAPTGACASIYSWEEAASRVAEHGGPALLTIGVRHLRLFAATGVPITARVLPLPESLDECFRLGLVPQNIIAVHPPFSAEFNRACIRYAGARLLVTKDSGSAGGLPAKLEAARSEGIEAIVVSRPAEPDAIDSIEALLAGIAAAASPGGRLLQAAEQSASGTASGMRPRHSRGSSPRTAETARGRDG